MGSPARAGPACVLCPFRRQRDGHSAAPGGRAPPLHAQRRDGTMAAMEKTRGYAHRLDLRTDVTPVWAALTDSELLAQWCSPDATISARPGGLFRARVDRLTELEACIDVWVPEQRLRLSYLPSAALPPTESALVDDFILEPARSGTILRLLGSGIPADPQWDLPYLRLRTGWQAALVRLKALLESTDAVEGL